MGFQEALRQYQAGDHLHNLPEAYCDLCRHFKDYYGCTVHYCRKYRYHLDYAARCQAAARRAEERRLIAERIAERKREAEEKRLAEEKKQAEQKLQQEEARRAGEKRQAELRQVQEEDQTDLLFRSGVGNGGDMTEMLDKGSTPDNPKVPPGHLYLVCGVEHLKDAPGPKGWVRLLLAEKWRELETNFGVVSDYNGVAHVMDVDCTGIRSHSRVRQLFPQR